MKKEKVIAPVPEYQLGVECFADKNPDTDILGIFTQEIIRMNDPISTARAKCHMAMSLNNCDLAVSSERSFDTHPYVCFIHADDEIMFFIDRKHNLEIIARQLSTEINFGGNEIFDDAQLVDFSTKILFPSHGLIVRKAKEDFAEMTKGITDWEKLNKSFRQLIEKYGAGYVETNIRAMHNPTECQSLRKQQKN